MHNNYQLGAPACAEFPKLYHPSITVLPAAVSVYYIFDFPKLYHPPITVLSAAVSVYYIFDTRPLCINFDTHLIEYVNYLLPVICIIDKSGKCIISST